VGLFFLIGPVAAILLAWFHPYKNYPADEKIILIPRGTSSLEVARRLEAEGIVMHRTLFLTYLKILKRSGHLQAGEYQFQGTLTIPQVADKIIRGLVHYHEVTIPEGFSFFEISELLEQKGFAIREEFLSAVRRVDLVGDLTQSPTSLEGFLFPDTYRLTRGETASEVVQSMIERFKQVYQNQLKIEIQHQPMSLKDVITLASLIEKETGADDERALVSAVFHNRLKRGMPLQCDPTVIYAAKLRGAFKGEIYRSDLSLDSAYNTYRYPGLPPGPIANPGLQSIEAALKPAAVDYLYFVSDNNGRHVFSTTLDQHNRAVASYRHSLRLESKKAAESKQGKL
jgi:peptidoglycan lytic transglycosylase G